MTDDHQANLETIKEALGDLPAAELRFAFFCSSLWSFKRETLLRPFPPRFRQGDVKDFDALGTLVRKFPSLSPLNSEDGRELAELSEDLAYLLAWIFSSKSFSISSRSCKTLQDLDLVSDRQIRKCRPDFVFEVGYSDVAEAKFVELNPDTRHPLALAFHGSQLCNFHSIIHHGLVSNLNKTALFGAGTYLSHELEVSLNWSPPGSVGPVKSALLGERLNCVALCEVIQDPAGVAFDSKPGTSSAFSNSVPEKYLVVRNDTLVRVKYLLVYSHKTSQSGHRFRAIGNRTQQWLWDHRFWLVMLLYGLMLMSVGVANSRNLQLYLKRWSAYIFAPASYEDF